MCMGRTNIEIDDELVERVMKLYGKKTKREAVDYALRILANRPRTYEGLRKLEGIGWDGDLEQMRGGPLQW